ncbi:siderophore-interacting protein [Bradyrhizobium japonicum]|uniref:siderophore-interacting protein n=1 Tax=Bradyrhizobium japonicum TaxID=375 RepID=UPI0020110833|nr:siderophore-interacting protein [Bradyrhizobium japonicum]
MSEPSKPPQGPVARMLLQWLMRPARVTGVETLSPRFRSIELEGDALKGVAWTIGQKIQVAMGSGLSARTYTPVSWDAEKGRTRLLAFAHGNGPGSRWVSALRQGDICWFFGPRRSLDLSAPRAPTVLFGDETAFGVASAFRDNRQVDYVFEVSDAAEADPVLAAIGLGGATLIARSAEDAHLASVDAELLRFAASAHFVLTGKASSIQRISRSLKAAGVARSRMSTKAYWAPGKTGLD